MTEQSPYTSVSTPDNKRRKVEVETFGTKVERTKGAITDKAKANYVREHHSIEIYVCNISQLSSQLRLRLQYAKLKVEHGWQRQSLSEVENLYFRHTHLTRPYPVISPGGRRNGRTLSSSNPFASSATQQENVPSMSGVRREHTLDGAFLAHTSAGAGPSSRPNGTLSGSSSSSSGEFATTPTMPSTPTADASRIATPFAPHVGFGSTVTRYPIARSDSASTVIMESTPSLYLPSQSTSTSRAKGSNLAPSSTLVQQSPSTPSTYREPFDPMEPTEHLDSQLAALRSIISASSMPIPLPPPTPSSAATPASPAGNNVGSGGLTYDAFWSAHGSATTSYRSTLGTTQAARAASATPLQAHASAPAVLGPSGVMNANQNSYGS
ncbi:hypothetical protein C8Q74DRAFT_526120 [Fomes fomentarius]|nr:hypothetical protein C8Q74DRAFT_526120 [Fomes fomentarius]